MTFGRLPRQTYAELVAEKSRIPVRSGMARRARTKSGNGRRSEREMPSSILERESTGR